jgi:hypothetical protein
MYILAGLFVAFAAGFACGRIKNHKKLAAIEALGAVAVAKTNAGLHYEADFLIAQIAALAGKGIAKAHAELKKFITEFEAKAKAEAKDLTGIVDDALYARVKTAEAAVKGEAGKLAAKVKAKL